MKPRIITKCVANGYASSVERIIEFSNGSRTDLKGGLIELRNLDDGSLLVNVYRCDAGVIVKASEPELPAALEQIITEALDASFACGEHDDYSEESWGDVFAHSEVAKAALRTVTREMLQALRAIHARIQGVFDAPELVPFGPLSGATNEDVLQIARDAIAKAEGRS